MLPPVEIARAKQLLGPLGGEWLLEFNDIQNAKLGGRPFNEIRFEELLRLVQPFLDAEHARLLLRKNL